MNAGEALLRAASTALSECLKVSKGEGVLLIYDESSEPIAAAFKEAAGNAGLRLVFRRIDPSGRNGADPDPETARAMLEYKVIIAPTLFSMTHCPAMRKAREAGARAATLPGVTTDIFARGLQADHMELSKSGMVWIERLEGHRAIRITSEAGTDIQFKTGSSKFMNDDGLIHSPGVVGNLPAGEVFVAPDRGSANGTLVIDGSIGSLKWDKSDKPAIVELKDGVAVSFKGSRGEALKSALLSAGGEAGLELAEFGIGTNPHLRLGGNLLEDEKVKGTVHLAFGNNRGFGGWNDVPVHIDGLVLSPTLLVDGVQLMCSGRWLL